jgi:hypothetical protein
LTSNPNALQQYDAERRIEKKKNAFDTENPSPVQEQKSHEFKVQGTTGVKNEAVVTKSSSHKKPFFCIRNIHTDTNSIRINRP